MTVKITESTIRKLRTGRQVFDSEIKGFGARNQRASVRFFLKYRMNGKHRLVTIGRHGPVDQFVHESEGGGFYQKLVFENPSSNWSVDKARKEATRLRGLIASGIDPAHTREEAKTNPTARELGTDYLERHGDSKRTGDRDRDYLERVIFPAIGSKKVVDVTRRDIEDIHRAMSTTPYAANRVLSLLKTVFQFAVLWEWRATNPATGIKRYYEESRQRFLSEDEIARLANALTEYAGHHPVSANAIRLLLLTGARRGEVLNATWAQFDLDKGTWTKPSAHTKQKREHRIPLSPPAIQLLQDMREDRRGEYVFPGREPDKPLTSLRKPWEAACRKAGLEGVRLHDLRHTYASVLASSGMSLPIIGALLGHTNPFTTQRYAQLQDDPLREATNRVGAVWEGKQAEVIPMRKRPA